MLLLSFMEAMETTTVMMMISLSDGGVDDGDKQGDYT